MIAQRGLLELCEAVEALRRKRARADQSHRGYYDEGNLVSLLRALGRQ